MAKPLFASALSTASDSASAEREVLDELNERLDGRTPALVTMFVTHDHGGALEGLAARIQAGTGAECLIGCTGESIIGSQREVENGPALALWAVAAPEMRAQIFTVGVQQTSDGYEFSGLPPVESPEASGVLLLGEPYSFPMGDYLELLNDKLEGVPAFGGMASGGTGPGQNFLFADGRLLPGGAVGVVVEGSVEIASVVSQGCRPVGEPWVVTACHDNIIEKLGGRPAARVLIETLEGLDESDRALLQKQPFVGLAIDAMKSSFERADFLVRGILGLQAEQQTIAVGASMRNGQTIQFLVRDAASAGEDLSQLMQGQVQGSPSDVGALVFSCNGRGSRMFSTSDHDISCVQAAFSEEIPAAGFFAMGEIGPVGGHNFLHGHTASIALFRERRA